jgi:hypothetical protein
VAIHAPLLKLLNRKAGYINERLRYIASSLPRLTYTPHPRFVVDSVIQRSLLCKDGLHFSSRGSVQVVADLEKAISTVRASLHAAQKRPVVSRPATPRPVVTPSEDTKTVSFSYRDALLTTFQISVTETTVGLVEPVTETTVGLAVNKDKMLEAYETGNKAGKLSMVNKGMLTGCRI